MGSGIRVPGVGRSNAGDPIGSAVVEIVADAKEYQKGLKASENALKKFDKETSQIAQDLSRNFALAGAAIGAGLAITIAKFADFEKSMKNVQAVAGATGEEYEKLKNFALEMGSQTVFSAREAGDAMYFLASAGQTVSEQMKTTASVLDLAAATQSGLAESSEIIVNSLSSFELQADQSRRVADLFAESISSSQANLQKLRIALPQTATVFSDLNQSIETNVAALSLLFDRGVRAETAATGLRNNLLTLLDATPDVTAGLSDLGLSVEDLNPQMNSLVEIVQKLEQAGFDTTDSVKIFGKEANALSVLVSTGADKLEEFEDALLGAAGAAEKMKDIQLDSLAGDIDLLKSSAEGAAISFGEGLSPAIRLSANALTSLISAFNDLPGPVKSSISIATASAATLLATLGLTGLAIPKITAGFKIFKEVIPLIGTDISILTGRLAAFATTPIAIALAGITAGVGVFAGALKLGTNQIEKTQEELMGLNSVTEAQRNNIALITEDIARWEAELKKLFDAQSTGTTALQRFNKETKEWIDIPIATQIEELEGKIAGLNKELRIEGGDVYQRFITSTKDLAEETSALAGELDTALNPLERLGEILLGVAANANLAAFGLGKFTESLEFLKGESTYLEFIEQQRQKVSAIEQSVGNVKDLFNELVDLFDFEDAGGGTDPQVLRGAALETKDSFDELQDAIRATQKADKELKANLEQNRIDLGLDKEDEGFVRRAAENREKAAEEALDNAAALELELDRLRAAGEQAELERIVRLNLLSEKDHQKSIDAAIELGEIEREEARKTAFEIDKLERDAEKRLARKKKEEEELEKREKREAQILRDSTDHWEEYGDSIIDVLGNLTAGQNRFVNAWLDGLSEWSAGNAGILDKVQKLWSGTARSMIGTATSIFFSMTDLVDKIVEAQKELARLESTERLEDIQIWVNRGYTFREAARIVSTGELPSTAPEPIPDPASEIRTTSRSRRQATSSLSNRALPIQPLSGNITLAERVFIESQPRIGRQGSRIGQQGSPGFGMQRSEAAFPGMAPAIHGGNTVIIETINITPTSDMRNMTRAETDQLMRESIAPAIPRALDRDPRIRRRLLR